MISKSPRKNALLASTLVFLFSANTFALESDSATPVEIPKLDNAQVFADFNDELPAVLNYFTRSTEDQVIAFYQQHYREATSRERKRGRLTLSFSQEKQNIRVVISQQNNKRQVDVIVEESNK